VLGGSERKIAVSMGGSAARVNITVVPQTPTRGFMTAWSGKYPRPETSNVNWQNGDVESNFAEIGLDNGWMTVWVSQTAHIIVDLQAIQP
jgi:hypothetical protein